MASKEGKCPVLECTARRSLSLVDERGKHRGRSAAGSSVIWVLRRWWSGCAGPRPRGRRVRALGAGGRRRGRGGFGRGVV